MPAPYHHGDLRAALLTVAESILEHEGFQALTLRHIARTAGVSHAAPAYHFGDLAGLLSDLATAGYQRFGAAMAQPSGGLHGMGRAYVAFATAHPNLFQLMFRSDRLDFTRPALRTASQAALTGLAIATASPDASQSLPNLAATWAIAHGLALLLIDGRLAVLTDNTNALVDAALSRLQLPFPTLA